MLLRAISLNFFTGRKIRSLNILFVFNFLVVLVFFCTLHIVLLYLLFEISVIPIFLIVAGWGYQPERIKASYAIMFYTIISSVPLLVCVLSLNLLNPGIRFNVFTIGFRYGSVRRLIRLGLLVGFLVKLPIYGAHLWLPLAHVEAPVYGSIILAGVLLKLGGLGVFRLSSLAARVASSNVGVGVSIIGIRLVGLTCLKITDLKSIIAFSSVSHIGIVIIISIFMAKLFAWRALFIILTHAFRSSFIFYGRYVIYCIRGTRNILLNKGGVRLLPRFSLCWLVATIARMGTPPFINLASEVYSIFLRVNYLGLISLLLVPIFMFGRCYHLILYRSSQQELSRWDSVSTNSRITRLPLIVSHMHSRILILRILSLVIFGY